jgi:hypothetical protein
MLVYQRVKPPFSYGFPMKNGDSGGMSWGWGWWI